MLKSQLDILGNNTSGNNGDIVEIKNYLQQPTASEREYKEGKEGK